MSRKRLGRVDPAAAAGAREAAKDAARTTARAPIAQIASGVGQEIDAEIHRLRAELSAAAGDAATLKAAEAEGRVLQTLPLTQIDIAYMTRDRLTIYTAREDWAALKASIAARGQQMPIEVADQGTAASPRYGLISGMRRVLALSELFQETGDERFSKVVAMLRPADMRATDRLIAMIEENEVRADLSFYERGRIAALAAEQGLYADADAAVDALFSGSHRNRRYKIRCFVTVHETLDDALWYPQSVGERLGIQLAKAIRAGQGPAIRNALESAGGRDAETEAQLLSRLVTALETSARPPKPRPIEAGWTGPAGQRVSVRSVPGTGRVTLDLESEEDLDEAMLQRLADWLGREITG